MPSATGSIHIRLTWDDPTTGTEEAFIGPLPVSIGRTADQTIALNSGQISRRHALLEDANGAVVVTDQKSSNGTFVNNQRITSTQVRSGDGFQIGPFTFMLDILSMDEWTALGSNTPTIVGSTSPATLPNVAHTPPQIRVRWTNSSNQTQEQVFPPPVTFGRADDATIRLMNDRKISRRHATLTLDGGRVMLSDNGSSNGVFVNDAQLPPERAIAIQPNDCIRLGNHTLTAVLEGSPAPAIAPALPSSPMSKTEASLVFGEAHDALIPFATPVPAPVSASVAFPPAFFNAPFVSVRDLERSGLPVSQTVYLAVGGGLGSFVWCDYLSIYGANPNHIVALGLEPKPHARYSRLCRNSQIPLHERLRSNSDSCPDNVWGWPSYAVREFWGSVLHGQLGHAGYLAWQVFSEPTLAQTYTPRSGDVFASIDREAARIGWDRMWRYGRVKAIRKTDDGRYAVAYSTTNAREGVQHALMLCQHLQLAVGYPGVRFLPDLQAYRERTKDFKTVVNAYESHEHVYEHLLRNGGVILIRGRGIVASRIIQRVYELRRQNPRIAVLHLMRSPVAMGNRYGKSQRFVEAHWEFQPFNWPKGCWGGEQRDMLERASDQERDQLLNDWGGTTTADRADWRDMVNGGLREGWYQIRFGDVSWVDKEASGRLVTIIKGKVGFSEESHLTTDFIVDCTGLEATVDSNPLLKDMVDHYQLGNNPKGRLRVTNDFAVAGMENGPGRMYAAGAMTLGGPYAAVDSFLGLQYAGLRAVDSLTKLRAPGLRGFNGLRSLGQWFRWAGGVHP